MPPELIFMIDLIAGYLVAGLFAVNYIWPKMASMDRVAAFKLLATFHI